jgi:ABC-type Fe3+-hydroxamate transport system substrate-binding protein
MGGAALEVWGRVHIGNTRMKNGIPGPVGSGFFVWRKMARTILLVTLAAGLVLAAGCGESVVPVKGLGEGAVPPQRIVSLAPSLTETLFALGVGERVVGVTRYCSHPAEALELPKIGGHLDPNFEAIVRLEPDLVVAIPSSRENRIRLEGLGIKVATGDLSARSSMNV